MKQLLVKICGLGSPEDAAAASAAGADYIGVVLVPNRMRTRTLEEAGAIMAEAPGVLRVGVFANARQEDILSASSVLRLDAIQLHGSEPALDLVKLRALGAPPLWKVISPPHGSATLDAFDAYAAVADAIVLDGGDGGRGVVFDWAAFRPLRSRLPRGVRLVVAGGLTPANVAQAVRELSPDIVDVSSGVESSPGRKAAHLIREFIMAAQRAAAG